jgi:hypothetical protein
MIWLKGLLSGAWGYIAAAGAVLLAILLALREAKKAGQTEVIAESAKKEIEDVKKANEIERDVATTKPDDVRKRLLDRYSRD